LRNTISLRQTQSHDIPICHNCKELDQKNL